ncbi:hypothetical protein ACN2C7_16685 [Caulobacter sp. ErkDOM-E]|uniref:hypothetical protein n=1 Tax=Caulobacter sp. ErkDOM-E TaxID=3402778 RepID=UPI003AF909F6
MPEPRQATFGWATADLIHLDRLAPGLIGRVMTVSPRRRQAIFAVIASRAYTHIGQVDDATLDAELAHILRQERAAEILAYAFGAVPEGLMGTLEKFDVGPMPTSDAYEKLRLVFTDPANRAKADLLARVTTINEGKLAVIDALDPRWRIETVLDRINLAMAARELNRAMAFVQAACSKATDETLVRALSRLPAERSLADLVTRYLRRADRFPDQPVNATQELRPLIGAEDFLRTGLRYRNCLRDRIGDALTGRAAFIEFRGEAILELHPLAGGFGWLLEEVHVARNDFVPLDLRRDAEAACLQAGVHHVDHRAGGSDIFRWCRLLQGHAAA